MSNPVTNDRAGTPWRRSALLMTGAVLLGLLLGVSLRPAGAQTVGVASSTATLSVYGDGLGSAWKNESWGANVRFGIASPVFDGKKAISYTVNQGWLASPSTATAA